MPMAEAAKKTREFRCPPHEQVRSMTPRLIILMIFHSSGLTCEVCFGRCELCCRSMQPVKTATDRLAQSFFKIT